MRVQAKSGAVKGADKNLPFAQAKTKAFRLKAVSLCRREIGALALGLEEVQALLLLLSKVDRTCQKRIIFRAVLVYLG